MRRKAKVLTAAAAVVICIICILCARFGNREDSDVVTFGDEIRPVRDGWGNVTLYTERESFTWSLMQDSQSYDYAMAEIAVGEESAAFDWTFSGERDSLTGQYISAKNDLAAHGGEEPLDYWLFLKIKTEDVYDLDIWHKVQEVWGADLEENHDISAFVNETGSICAMREYQDGNWIGGWSTFIKDDFLYVIECVDNQFSSGEDTLKPINYFYWSGILTDAEQYCMWGMDDELFYWRDHDERVIRLENPSRVYTQVPGKDGRWSHFPGKQPCAILQNAEYTVSLSEDSPLLRICFTLEGEAMELRLPDIGSADYPYKMEVSDAESGELLQVEEERLCVDAIDTLRFEDLDGDGYLDMHIVYPEHYIVAESDAEDQFSYQYYCYRTIPSFWIWDTQEHLFVHMNEWELSDYIQEGKAEKGTHIIVQEGDSLWRLARKYLGDGAKYIDLYEQNREVIGSDPDRIVPGMELEISDNPR